VGVKLSKNVIWLQSIPFTPIFAIMIKKTFFKISVKKGLGWGGVKT
jgi:hypothetical protein